ncbi:MAG: hypothetical protein ABL901_08560 [Hyphomicrobiaceae bacterium]
MFKTILAATAVAVLLTVVSAYAGKDKPGPCEPGRYAGTTAKGCMTAAENK